MSERHVSGTFAGAASSDPINFPYPTGLSVKALSLTFAASGSVKVERRIDGANWRTATSALGVAYVFTGNVECNIEVVPGAQYRVTCTAAAGDIAYYFGAPLG